MASFDLCTQHLIQWEGGWSNDPNDLGGATNCGLTFKFFQEYANVIGIEKPTIDDLKNLTWEKALMIYRNTMWKWMEGDMIQDQKVALALFDAFVNLDEWGIAMTGRMYSKAVSMMQKILGITETGVMGAATMTAINKADPSKLFKDFNAARIQYYKNICVMRPQNKVFLNGWTKRVEALG